MVVQPRVQVSDLQLDQQASAQLGQDLSFDYILKEILFISTTGNASARTGQANKYRSSFQGCDSAVQLSLNYTDAAVRDMGRRHATQLPEALAKELAGLNVGGITKPRVTEGGVSMLAICSKTAARDTTFLKNKLRSQQGTEAMKAEGEKYMEELRKKAQVVYSWTRPYGCGRQWTKSSPSAFTAVWHSKAGRPTGQVAVTRGRHGRQYGFRSPSAWASRPGSART